MFELDSMENRVDSLMASSIEIFMMALWEGRDLPWVQEFCDRWIDISNLVNGVCPEFSNDISCWDTSMIRDYSEKVT